MATPLTSIPGAASSLGAAAASASKPMIAQTFDSFLTLLTTQLKNQNPLDPLDTNQFTQQLVQFAQVEQQMATNASLNTLIALQQASQLSQAVDLIGKTVTVGGDTAQLKNGLATWSFSTTSAANATITIADSTGRPVFSGNYTLASGNQTFTWDGRGINGTRWPDGNYRISVSATDSKGQAVTVSTDVMGTVDGVDLTQTPPTVTINGQTFALSKIRSVVRSGV
jgi:flagellar basal-body rod modification protein FlgD